MGTNLCFGFNNLLRIGVFFCFGVVFWLLSFGFFCVCKYAHFLRWKENVTSQTETLKEAPVNSEVMAKPPSQQACNSDVTSCSGWANPNLFYFNTVTKKGVSQLLSHTSEVSSKTYLALVGDQTDYLTEPGCGCKKLSLVSVIVIHNVIYITWCNYCRVNKGTRTKGIIFVTYLELCHILF